MLVFGDEWDTPEHLDEERVPLPPFPAVQLCNIVRRGTMNYRCHLVQSISIRLAVDLLYQAKMTIHKTTCVANTHKRQSDLLMFSGENTPSKVASNRVIFILPNTVITVKVAIGFTQAVCTEVVIKH